MKWLLVIWYITNTGHSGSAEVFTFEAKADCQNFMPIAVSIYEKRFSKVKGECQMEGEKSA
jgi:hypothetical protein